MVKATLSSLHKTLSLPLDKNINQHAIERWSSALWSVLGGKSRNKGQPFVMIFPPPNITGNLHLGHALTGAIQDALMRYQAMKGRDTRWIPGFDHAGLATQNIVERLIWNRDRVSRIELGREKFIEEAERWKDLKRKEMRSQLDRLGLSLDYEEEYFTMDEKSSLAVQTAFKRLFEAGVIYRASKPVFWSKDQGTTLSDIEVECVDNVYRYFRTGEIVERRPLLQWFINAKTMAHRAVEVVERSSIEIVPPNYKKSWSSWLVDNGVQDWCISRQSWWGHRIPAYKLKSKPDLQESWVIADSFEEASNKLGGSPDIIQDPDVLDTWFSSSLLPLTISGWPDRELFDKNCERHYFPLHMMETGFDILNFWVSKMVMMSLELEGKIPFNMILLHGMICDSNGKKMSKSKGNVIDPLDVIDGARLEDIHSRTISSRAIEDHQIQDVLSDQKKMFPNGIPACGADGLRAYLLSHDFQEEVIRINIDQIDRIRRLSNKIWNIYRYVLVLLDNVDKANMELCTEFNPVEMDDSDLQVLTELSKCSLRAYESFNQTHLIHQLFSDIELFWTKHLSSVYIEQSKSLLNQKSSSMERRMVKIKILVKCLATATKLLHPIMPHMTEFLYQKLNHVLKSRSNEDQNLLESIKSIGSEPYPIVEDFRKYFHKEE